MIKVHTAIIITTNDRDEAEVALKLRELESAVYLTSTEAEVQDAGSWLKITPTNQSAYRIEKVTKL